MITYHKPMFLQDHIDRARNSAAMMGMKISQSDEDIIRESKRTMEACSLDQSQVHYFLPLLIYRDRFDRHRYNLVKYRPHLLANLHSGIQVISDDLQHPWRSPLLISSRNFMFDGLSLEVVVRLSSPPKAMRLPRLSLLVSTRILKFSCYLFSKTDCTTRKSIHRARWTASIHSVNKTKLRAGY